MSSAATETTVLQSNVEVESVAAPQATEKVSKKATKTKTKTKTLASLLKSKKKQVNVTTEGTVQADGTVSEPTTKTTTKLKYGVIGTMRFLQNKLKAGALVSGGALVNTCRRNAEKTYRSTFPEKAQALDQKNFEKEKEKDPNAKPSETPKNLIRFQKDAINYLQEALGSHIMGLVQDSRYISAVKNAKTCTPEYLNTALRIRKEAVHRDRIVDMNNAETKIYNKAKKDKFKKKVVKTKAKKRTSTSRASRSSRNSTA